MTEYLARFVAGQVAPGRFGSAREVVRAGLRLLERETAAGSTAPHRDGPADRDAPPPGLAARSVRPGKAP